MTIIMQKVRKAIFPVGGLGTRFLPATKAMPKEMLPVVDKPLIQYAFEEARAAGIEQFIFITGRNKNVLNNHFDHSYELQKLLSDKEKKDLLGLTRDWLPQAGQIAFIRQQEALGLGHAVWCARNFIGNEPFAVLLADEMILSPKPFLKEMVEAYGKKKASIVGVAEVAKEKVNQYGIIDAEKGRDGLLKINGMVEKPEPAKAPSNLSIIGRYILQPEIIFYLDKMLYKKGIGGEVQLTDAMAAMLKEKPFYAMKLKGKRYDCGSRKGWLEANIAFALDRPDMRKDVEEIIKKFNMEV